MSAAVAGAMCGSSGSRSASGAAGLTKLTSPPSFEGANCQELEWHFQTARSAVVARDPVLEEIHRYKYISP